MPPSLPLSFSPSLSLLLCFPPFLSLPLSLPTPCKDTTRRWPAVWQSGRQPSPRAHLCWHLDLIILASRTVRNKKVLLDPPSLWYSLTAARAKTALEEVERAGPFSETLGGRRLGVIISLEQRAGEQTANLPVCTEHCAE